MKKINLDGKKVGRLTVIKRLESDSQYVVCKCDCGNICTVRAGNLTNLKHPQQSCGCLRRENGRATMKKNQIWNSRPVNKKFHFMFERLFNDKANKNSTTGYKGVYKTKNDRYIARIRFQGKLYNLGTYKTINEAMVARKEAEKEMYTPLIAARDEFLASQG